MKTTQTSKHIEAAAALHAVRDAHRKLRSFCHENFKVHSRVTRQAARVLLEISKLQCELDREFHNSMSEREFQRTGARPAFPWYSKEP